MNDNMSKNIEETFLGKQVIEAFLSLFGDDPGAENFVFTIREDGWYMIHNDGRIAKARLATGQDMAEDPYDSVLFRFDTSIE